MKKKKSRSQEVKKTKRSGIRATTSFLSLSKGSLVVVVCALKDARERERQKQSVFFP